MPNALCSGILYLFPVSCSCSFSQSFTIENKNHKACVPNEANGSHDTIHSKVSTGCQPWSNSIIKGERKCISDQDTSGNHGTRKLLITGDRVTQGSRNTECRIDGETDLGNDESEPMVVIGYSNAIKDESEWDEDATGKE